MKAIIDGIRYDTETARRIGESTNIGLISRSDFTAWEATLYVGSRSGRYFLHGEGGPMTRFATGDICRGGQHGDEKIIPMSEEEAFEWAQAELDVDTVSMHFDHMIKDA